MNQTAADLNSQIDSIRSGAALTARVGTQRGRTVLIRTFVSLRVYGC